MGWVLSEPRLRDWNQDGIDIKANTSICMALAGIGLMVYIFAPGRKTIIRGAGIVVSIICGLTFIQHIIGVNFGIDALLFNEAPGARATTSPGRMGLPASTALTSLGIALALLTTVKYRRWASLLATGALAISTLSLVGYLFGASQLYSIPRFTGIALQTASMIAMLGIGLAASVPEHGLVAVVNRDDSGGLVFRRLFLPLIAIALGLGWVRIAGQEAGLYDTAFGTSARTFVEIILLLGILWWTANDISRSEKLVLEAATAVTERDERLSGVLESLSDAFISFDADLRITYVNAAVMALLKETSSGGTQIIGRHVFDVFPEARSTRLGEQLLRCADTREPIDVEEYYPPFDRWFHSRYFPTADRGVSLFALDITERKRAEQLVTRRAHDLAVLYGFADRLNRAGSVAEVYEAALDTIISSLGCDRASILLFNGAGEMCFAASRGLSDKYKSLVEGHSPWKRGEVGAVPIGVADLAEAEIDEDLRTAISDEGIRSLAFIPLVSNEELIGKFMVYYDRPHVYTESEFEMLLTVGFQIAVGVERMNSETALRENEERLRLATQTGKVGVWDWDIRADSVSWTESVYTMHGVEPGGFDGSVESFASLVHPDDREFVQGRIERALSGTEPYEIEFRVAKPSGGIGWLYTNALVLSDTDGPCRMIGATIDITGRKLAEQESARFAAIVDSSRDAIISKDLTGIIQSWNKGAERLFGYQPDEVIGKSVTVLIPADRAHEEVRILERLNRGEYIDHYETIRRHKDGTLLDISLTVSPVFDANGKITGASKIARDITERRRAAAALRDREIMQRLVEAQEAERHRIARDLHDHLGQQLTALRLKLQSIRSKCADDPVLAGEVDETQRYASRIDMDINYLAWELRPTELDHLGLNDALASFVREWSNTYGIPAEFHAMIGPHGRLHPELETNLYRIVQEALNNILKHAEASSVSVLIDGRTEQISLIIEDDGHGFMPNAGRRNGTGGKGLGLVGMRERTALLGGTLEIESTPDGTTVFARVPIRFAETNGDGPPVK